MGSDLDAMPLAVPRQPAITYHAEVDQGSGEWMELRRGILTASEMCRVMTPTLKPARNDKSRAHMWELAAQRISGHVEPQYISDDMLRGMDDEAYARDIYAEKYAPVTRVGFVTRSDWGFTIGYSPDGLVGDDGLIEIKSRRQRFQIQTIVTGIVPDEYMLQIQTGLLVTGRKWLDFISYSGGLPMFVRRVFPDGEIQAAIIEAAAQIETEISERMSNYAAAALQFPPTERRIEQEIIL